MEPSDAARATGAAVAIVTAAGLRVDEPIVLQSSNTLALRLLPCDVVARVAPVGREVAAFEVELARRLADAGCPTAVLDPRIPPQVHEREGFAVTLWTHYGSVRPRPAPEEYADALARLHTGMRRVQMPVPHFTDRVAAAEHIVGARERSPELDDDGRALLTSTLRRLRRAIVDHGAPEQLLHGEPHPGNVLVTAAGPRFIDLETCCRGPVELDLAHAPATVVDHYPGVDRILLDSFRALVLAMVAAWRWEAGDQLPNGAQAGRALVGVLRAGPPWPTLDSVFDAVDDVTET